MGQPLYRGEDEKLALEARNGLLLYDEIIRIYRTSGDHLDLTPDLVRGLHRITVSGLYTCAGSYRDHAVTIRNSSHKPPEHVYVPGLVDDLCHTANTHTEWDPTITAAYVIWRLNWIHPFGGGNGRTSRALGYLALLARLGFMLPGKLTIPEQIVNERARYQRALEDADAAWREHSIVDVTRMKDLLDELLERQLSFLDEEGDE